ALHWSRAVNGISRARPWLVQSVVLAGATGQGPNRQPRFGLPLRFDSQPALTHRARSPAPGSARVHGRRTKTRERLEVPVGEHKRATDWLRKRQEFSDDVAIASSLHSPQ